MKYIFLLFLSFSLFSCKKEAETDMSEMLMSDLPLSKKIIDSIKASEASKTMILREVNVELDSATSIKLALPIDNIIGEGASFPSEVVYNDIDTLSSDYSEDYFLPAHLVSAYGLQIIKEHINFEKSENPNLFTIAKVKELNEISAIIYEDKNSLLYLDPFGKQNIYHRIYLPDMGFYLLYQAEIPKIEDTKLQYSLLFNSLNKAKNLLNYAAINDQNLTWQKIKPTVSKIELDAISKFYDSFKKEIRYFMSKDEVEIYKMGDERFSIFRNEDHTINSFDMTESLASSEFNGTFEDLDQSNNLREAMQNVVFSSDHLQFERRIAPHTILMKTYSRSGDDDSVKYFTITSIELPEGQFYLTYITDSEAKSPAIYMNEYFSNHLKL